MATSHRPTPPPPRHYGVSESRSGPPGADRRAGAAPWSPTVLATVDEVEPQLRPTSSGIPDRTEPRPRRHPAVPTRRPRSSREAVSWHVAPAFVIAVALGGIVMGTIAAFRPPHAAPWPAGPIGHLLGASMAGPAWWVGLSWAAAILVVVVAHEAGHAFTATRVGGRDVRVDLAGMHGRTSYSLDDPWSGRRALVIAAGALAPSVFVPLLLVHHAQAFGVVGSVLLLTNVLPLPISDGGHLLALLLHRATSGGARTQRRAGLVELLVLEVLMLGAISWGFGWLAGLLAPVVAMAIAIELRHGLAGPSLPDPAPVYE